MRTSILYITIIIIYLNSMQHVKLWHRRRQCENIYSGAALRRNGKQATCDA